MILIIHIVDDRGDYIKIHNTIGSDWKNDNQRIKEVGIRQYFAEKKDVSHYISYKKMEENK